MDILLKCYCKYIVGKSFGQRSYSERSHLSLISGSDHLSDWESLVSNPFRNGILTYIQDLPSSFSQQDLVSFTRMAQ